MTFKDQDEQALLLQRKRKLKIKLGENNYNKQFSNNKMTIYNDRKSGMCSWTFFMEKILS